MKIDQFPSEMQPYVIPEIRGEYLYRCLGCGSQFGIEELLYTCPKCDSVLLIEDRQWERLKEVPGEKWRRIFRLQENVECSGAQRDIPIP